jgi:hypothetical protein
MEFKELKIIRVYTQGEVSTCSRAYTISKNKIKKYYSYKYNIIFEERNLTQVVKLNSTEDEHIKWLTEKDGCLILCHPFQGNYPPNWNYKYFLSKLKEVAIAKGIRMFPDPDLLDDPTFSQVSIHEAL